MASTTIFSKESSSNHSSQSQVSGEIMNSTLEPQIYSKNHSISILDNVQDQRDATNFSISPEKLAELVEKNDINFLSQSQGVQHIVAALETDIETGITGDQSDLHRRRAAFGSNQYSEGQPSLVTKNLCQFALDAFKDTTVMLLLCCATLSLAIGIKRNGPQEGLTDGALIFLAIFGVVNFGVICRFIKSRWMIKKLKKHKKVVCVVRQGKLQTVSASEVVVGDIVCLEKGNEVPADGLFTHGNSSFKLDCGVAHKASNLFMCPAMFSWSKVAEGSCQMLVTSVGKNTERSKLMRLLRKQQTDNYDLKMQTAIDKVSSNLENVWLILSLLVLVVQVLRCFVWESKSDENHNPDPKGVKNTVEEIMNETTKLMKKQSVKVNGLVTVLCVLVFALRDCLPLGIFTIFLYSSKKIKSLRAMVEKLPACATLGLISTICISKTDDLALQYTKMAELWIGMKCIQDVSKEVDEQVLKALQEAIYCTTSSGLGEDDFLLWAQKVLGVDANKLQNNCQILQSEAVDLNGSHSRLVLTQDEEADNKVQANWKGAPKQILSMCSYYADANGTMQTLDEEKIALFSSILENIASGSLRCFAFAYKQVKVEEEGPDHKPYDIKEKEDNDNDEKTIRSEEHGLTLLGMVCMRNPYAPEISQAVQSCLESGVNIKLVVDDDINTAKLMALHSGILRSEDDINQAVIEASIFRNSSEEDRMNMIDNVHVLANASPMDKLLMVQCLREKSEVVAVTGTGVRDFPSLKEADVGLLMVDHCADAAKEDVDIVVLGVNVGMISALVRFGRFVCNTLGEFIQFQLTVNIVAFTINFILLIFKSEVQFTAFQLLWVNLIMEVLGALALGIQMVELTPPLDEIRQSRPVYGAGPIITKTMWRNIAVQSLFQVTILVILSMKGKAILHVDDGVLRIMVFICYVLCQASVLLGSMKIKQTSALQGLLTFKNCLFLTVVGIIVIMQVALIEIMAITAHWRKLNLQQWCICTAIAALPRPIDYAVNWVKYRFSYQVNV